MNSSVTPLLSDVTTIADRIFETLRVAIVEGEIPAGSKISEPDLAKRYQVSRASIREAIGRLEACSLVTRRPNVGARVVALSSEQLLEIYHVREPLEGMAARLAAELMTDEEIVELRRLLGEHRDEVEHDTGHHYVQNEGDLDFHYRIVQGSNNSRMINLLCNDLYHLVRLYRFQFGMASSRGQQALSEHTHIVEAIERRDGELAEFLMRHHIRASRKNVERLLAERLSGQANLGRQ